MPSRRTALVLTAATLAAPRVALAASPRQVMWDDLIPPGVPYSEIVGEGELDAANDTWNPIFDENATKLNQDLDGAYIRMPGYIVPLEVGADGIRNFLLVPYVGACIHTPPPPANQLVVVTSDTPWPMDNIWDPVWVTGIMNTRLQSTDLGETGYALTAELMEPYEW